MRAELSSTIQPSAIKVKGKLWTTDLPKDLYVPPQALDVFLDAFEGPLDLLLYLIKRQNIDILDIAIAPITQQYMNYINMMQEIQIDLAAEYLVMAAMLAEIKAKMLLPRHNHEEGQEEDPRAELVRKLQEYEQYKLAAHQIDQLPRQGRDTFVALADAIDLKPPQEPPTLEFRELLCAFNDVLHRVALSTSHEIRRETLSVRERMTQILDSLQTDEFKSFHQCFNLAEGRFGVVVTFLAILELFKESLIQVIQSEAFGPIYLRATA